MFEFTCTKIALPFDGHSEKKHKKVTKIKMLEIGFFDGSVVFRARLK